MRIKTTSMSAKPQRGGPLAGVNNAPLRRRIHRALHELPGALHKTTGTRCWAHDCAVVRMVAVRSAPPVPGAPPPHREMHIPVGALLPSNSRTCHTSGDVAPGVLDQRDGCVYPDHDWDLRSRGWDAGQTGFARSADLAGFSPNTHNPQSPAMPPDVPAHPRPGRFDPLPLAVQGGHAGQAMTTLQGRQAHQAHQDCALRTIEWAMRQESPMAAIRAADFSQKRDGVVYYKQVRKSEKVGVPTSVVWSKVNSNAGGLLDDALNAV